MRHLQHCVFSLCVVSLLFGLGRYQQQEGRAQPAAPQATAPNELGKIMILEYHKVQPEESRWGRSIENFRHDLELLYASGYRPIGMADFIDGKISVPAGSRPFLLTFDDSSPGQFRYLIKDGKPEIDPDCALGILLHFHQLHPDFERKGIFFVLPAADEPNRLFGQPEFEARKIKELVSLGFEIGNHTLWHAQLSKYDANVVQQQIAMAVQAIQKIIPGYPLRALDLPLGSYPKDPHLAVEGSYQGIAYHDDAVLLVAGGPAPSPFSAGADFAHLPRIQVTGAALQNWIGYFERHPAEGYVSDGDVEAAAFPRALLPAFNASRFKSVRANPYRP
jgi:peptidoglycan/xylan/chitin deacetylase (PgdA/CDA1 family)